MKKLVFAWIIVIAILFREVIFNGLVTLPGDALIGSNYPWLDYKWGYITGVPVKNGGISDSYSQLFLWRQAATDMIRNAQWPLWTRYTFSGSPLLAAYQSSVLFPANIFMVLLPKYWGWNIYIIASIFFAGFSMMIFLSNLVRSRLAIAMGGLVFALAGFMTTCTELGTHVWAMGCLPWLLLSVDKFVLEKDRRYLYSIPVLVAILVFSGSLQVLIYGLVLVGAYALFRTTRPATLVKLLLAVVLGGMMTAMQILPTLDLYRHSIRNEENYAQKSNFGLSKWPQVIRLWSADFFGHPTTHNEWSGLDYIEYSSFLGTLAVVLVVASLSLTKTPEIKFFAIVLGILLIIVYDNPLSRLVFSLPIPILTNSLASRLFFMIGLVSSILTAFAIEAIWQGKLVKTIQKVSLVLLGLSWFWWWQVAPAQYKSIALRNLLWPSGLLIGLIIICTFASKRKHALVVFLVIFSLFDLGRYFRKFNTFFPAKLVFPTTPVIDFLTSHSDGFRIINSSDLVFPPNTWMAYRLESIEGYDPLQLLSYSRLMHVVNNQNYFNSPSRVLDTDNLNIKYLQALNVKYLVAAKGLGMIKQNRGELKMVFQDGQTTVWENPGVKNRLYFVDSYQVVSDEAGLATRLMDPAFNPTHQAVLLEDPRITINNSSDSKVTLTKLTDQSLEFETTVSTPQLMIISQSYDRGWKSFANGHPQPIYRADGGLTAVLVSPGKQTWKVKYLPDSFIIGSLVSLLSGVTWLLGIGILRFNENRRHI